MEDKNNNPMKAALFFIIFGGVLYFLLLLLAFSFRDVLNIHENPGMLLAAVGIASILSVLGGVIVGVYSLIINAESRTVLNISIISIAGVGVCLWFF